MVICDELSFNIECLRVLYESRGISVFSKREEGKYLPRYRYRSLRRNELRLTSVLIDILRFH